MHAFKGNDGRAFVFIKAKFLLLIKLVCTAVICANALVSISLLRVHHNQITENSRAMRNFKKQFLFPCHV